MIKYKIRTILLLMATLISSSYSHAKVEGFNIDGLIGMDFVTGGISSNSSTLGYGLRLGYHLNPTWEMGVGYTTSSSSSTVGTVITDSTTGLFMGDLVFHLDGEWNPLYFGVRLGAGFNSGTTTNTLTSVSGSDTSFAYGFVGGYDYKVAESFTIGPRLSYTMINHSGGNLGDFQAHAAFKYFF